ncbi:MAG: TonB-dependent receptor [Pseudomonadota bacterium]|nr:TonB-dependent receptor [Pseudomonadota bacterium]
MINARGPLGMAVGLVVFMGGIQAEENKTDKLGTVVVTATREEASLADTDASIGVVQGEDIEEINPTHPADAFNRIPGVNIVQLGSTGQGVAAAIRQPISYDPVYLYLENGIPIRSPAFFNHNSLYEVNVSGADGLEVLRGPGSALYGSDAIGGVINVLSGQPQQTDDLAIGLEAGEYGWRRARIRGAKRVGEQGFSGNLDVIDSDGWRENTAFDRQSFTGAWNTRAGAATVNTVLTATQLDMDTGGSGLRFEDYIEDPAQAGNLIGFRDVSAVRLSSAFEWEAGAGRISLTPYLRSNDLEYLATWTLNTGREVFIPWLGTTALDSQDAHVNESGHDSLGLAFKYRQDFAQRDGFWIAGVDLDYTQGYVIQDYIIRTDSDPGPYWLAYSAVDQLYDFDVDFQSVSPYLHSEWQLTERLRFNGGVRYDWVRYDYQNNLPTVEAGDLDDPSTPSNEAIHRRPADTTLRLDHFSPKLGLVYQFSDNLNGFASYRHAFRIPTVGQLFRSGSNDNSTDLEPVKADSVELGLRGQSFDRLAWEVATYYLLKRDDIINITDETGARRNVNAGETEHYGVELGADLAITDTLLLGLAYTRSEHKFKEWTVSSTVDYSGNTQPDAPEDFGSLRLSYRPDFLNGGRLEVEWAHTGEWYLDEANTGTYEGHDLLNLRANYYLINTGLELYAQLLNATDELYADTTSKWGPTYTPGRPRTLFVGMKYDFL